MLREEQSQNTGFSVRNMENIPTKSKDLLPRANETEKSPESITPNPLPPPSPPPRFSGIPLAEHRVMTIGTPAQSRWILTYSPYVRIFNARPYFTVLMYCFDDSNTPFVIAISRCSNMDPQQLSARLVDERRLSRVRNIVVIGGPHRPPLEVSNYVMAFRSHFHYQTLVEWVSLPHTWTDRMTWDVMADQEGRIDMISRGWYRIGLVP